MQEDSLLGDFSPYFVLAVLSAALATVIIVTSTGIANEIDAQDEEEANFL
jgi:hypothetical protein